MFTRTLTPTRQRVAKSINTKIYLVISLLLICSAISLSAQAQELLNEPQKVVVDVEHDRLLVSNFGNGAIVEIDTENKQKYFVENAGFVDGLEIVGNTVYGVGHSRKLFAYNLDTGEQVLDFHFTGVDSDYLSSVTSDTQGHLFISCPALHTIYKFKISDSSYQVFAQGNGLNRPNGILLEKENNRIVVIDDSPGTSIIHAISLSDATVTTLATTSFDRPDGIVRDANGVYYIGGYYLPGLYSIDANFSKEPEMFFEGSHMVYPTYDPRDHSLLVTYYGSNSWDKVTLPRRARN
jgi:DNA-binding beta-propeller fold protein YncE